VAIEWRSDFDSHTAPSEHSGALAFALPYRGTAVLAHVMAHEITHLLEAVSWHSETGVMKARWDADDFIRMAITPLSFEPEDIDLIQRGLRVSAVSARTSVIPATPME
jgi:hypothetical protein